MTSQVRQNFHKDCEDAINKQINMELYASYVYLSMVRNIFCYVFISLIIQVLSIDRHLYNNENVRFFAGILL